jgi:hypothetical protein
MRPFIDLLEHTHRHVHVWHGSSKQAAQHLIRHGIHLAETKHGRAFVAVTSPEMLDSEIKLEYRLDTEGITQDRAGPNGLYDPNDDTFYVSNSDNLRFVSVYDGVIFDPLEETDTNELDEYALGGLARCTAVTVNAILNHFHRPPIRINDVPIDQPGVLRILVAHGLAYRPYPQEVGRTVQQFGAWHKVGTWCLITAGHAMALVEGNLFDAENRNFDNRKLVAVFQMKLR